MTKETLAQPAQEPVATIAVRWHEPVGKVAYVLEVNLPVGIHELYPTPPQRPWVGLTRDEVLGIEEITKHPLDFYRAIEAALKERNA